MATMLGKKKKRDNNNNQPDEGDNGLHKNKSVLEYQNKCLCTLIETLRDDLASKNTQLSTLQKQFSALQNIYIKWNSQLTLINSSTQVSLKELKPGINDDIEASALRRDKYYSYPYETLIKLMTTITPTEAENIDVDMTNKENKDTDTSNTSIISELSNTINTLIKAILPLIQQSDTLIIKQQQSDFNSELQKSYEHLMSQYTQSQTDLITWKSQCKINEIEFEKSKAEIDKLQKDIFNLKRKVNTNPLLPYINWEKKFFQKQIEEHKCVCSICSNELNPNSSYNMQQGGSGIGNSLFNQGDNNNNNNNSNKNNPNISTLTAMSHISNIKDEEAVELLIKENDALKNRIKELHENIEKLTGECEITEDNLLQSAQFQSLVSQAESILFQLDSLKETNADLIKKNSSFNQVKDAETRLIQQRFIEKLEAMQKAIFDASKALENSKYTIQMLTNKIESLECIIKTKDSIDLNSMYDLFTTERIQLMKQMEAIKLLKKEYLNKYDEECLKNKTTEKTLSKLTHELEQYKQLFPTEEKNVTRKRSYDYTNEVIKRKQEKNGILKREITRLKSELDKERLYNEKLINLAETNENGVTNLNATIKNLKFELQEAKEIQAKMSNEKLKDNQVILLLREAKETFERKIATQQDQLENYDSFTKKIECELIEQRKLNGLLEENIKLNEGDIDKLKKANVENLKEIEKGKLFAEDYQKQLIEAKNNYNKQLTNYDVLKVKYDELCKFKKFDPSLIGYEDLQKENEILKLENAKYREMVHCKVCKTRIKNVIIAKCFHTFCKNCVDETFDNRKRKCPICREQITQNDVKDIYWD